MAVAASVEFRTALCAAPDDHAGGRGQRFVALLISSSPVLCITGELVEHVQRRAVRRRSRVPPGVGAPPEREQQVTDLAVPLPRRDTACDDGERDPSGLAIGVGPS